LSVDRAQLGTAVAVLSLCGQTWFYGGEVRATVTNAGSGIAYGLGALDLQHQAEFFAFGTAIRVDPGVLTDADIPGAVGSNAIWGVRLMGNSHFHLHGGIVNVSANTLQNADAVGIQILDAGAQFAHTPGAAFVLRPGAASGTPIRILTDDAAKVQSPFLWQNGPRPPQAATEASTLVSTDGSDLYVETDCSAAGDCNGGGSEAHLMVHNPTACTDAANAWLDTVTGRCRNDTTP
jgi:hypothetical protein